jgi:hypothetical protein
MANQNWYLQSHYHAQSSHTNLTISNLQSGTVTDDQGNTTAVNSSNFPVYRLVCKLRFDTQNMASNSYFWIMMGGNQSSWDGSNMYSGDWTSKYSSQMYSNYGQDFGNSRPGIYCGSGMFGASYNYYAWGSAVTDSEGVTVQSYDVRRGAYTTIDFNTYHQNTNWYPGGVGSSSGVYNGSSASPVTYQAESGSWGFATGGTSNATYFNEITLSSSYGFQGDILLYRGAIQNYVGN